MNKRVVITGLGVISSIGIGRQEYWEGLLAGRTGISPVGSFDTTGHFTHNGGEVKQFQAGAFLTADQIALMNRSTQMAVAAAKLAWEDASLSGNAGAGSSAGVSFGTTLGAAQAIEEIDSGLIRGQEPRHELYLQLPTQSMPGAIGRTLGLAGPCWMVTTACAAGNYAIAQGYDLIRRGRTDVMIAGASDAQSRIEFMGFNQFKAVAPEKCQPFDKNRKGMIPAEGAGVLVLEAWEHAVKRGARIHGEVIGYGLSCDAHHMTAPSVAGLVECMEKALHDAGVDKDRVSYISAHGTGTPANDRAECAAIHAVFGERGRTVPVSSIKSMLGHTMGAASALEAIACALAVRDDRLPPTINHETPDPECDIDCVPNRAREHQVEIALNNSYAFGGNNASVVLKKYRA